MKNQLTQWIIINTCEILELSSVVETLVCRLEKYTVELNVSLSRALPYSLVICSLLPKCGKYLTKLLSQKLLLQRILKN